MLSCFFLDIFYYENDFFLNSVYYCKSFSNFYTHSLSNALSVIIIIIINYYVELMIMFNYTQCQKQTLDRFSIFLPQVLITLI